MFAATAAVTAITLTFRAGARAGAFTIFLGAGAVKRETFGNGFNFGLDEEFSTGLSTGVAENLSITIEVNLDGPNATSNTSTLVLADILKFYTAVGLDRKVDRDIKFSALFAQRTATHIRLDSSLNTDGEFTLGKTIFATLGIKVFRHRISFLKGRKFFWILFEKF